MESNELIRGTLKPIILRMLSAEGKMYGYQITMKVRELTEGEIQLTEGALYPALHQLLNEGSLITETESFNGRKRVFYSLTDSGREKAAYKLSELRSFVAALNRLLDAQPGEI